MNEEEKKSTPVPTHAPDENEEPTTPTDYPLFKYLERIASSLEKIASAGTPININTTLPAQSPSQPKTTSPKENVAQKEPEASAVEKIKMAFPEDLEVLLNFEEKGDHVVIKPRQFLGSENFAKIASVVRGLNGEYISAGRDSHFRVKK